MTATIVRESIYLERASNGFEVHWDIQYKPMFASEYDNCRWECQKQIFEGTDDKTMLRAVKFMNDLYEGKIETDEKEE